MKKSIWTSALAMLLVIATMLTLVACGEKEPAETTSVSAYKSEGEYTELSEKICWEDINKFPVKNGNMSIDELRQLCVDFFRYCKTALWIPDSKWDFQHFSNNSMPDRLEEGVVYGGLPYIGLACGNIYRVLDYMDPETGVVDMQRAGRVAKHFGNQCAYGAHQGWSRVINSADYTGTHSMTEVKGFYRLGAYSYRDSVHRFDEAYGTDEVTRENGAETMYQSYAELKKGDGIVYYTTAGHVVMISGDAHVEKKADGSIDPDKSYVTVIDQTPHWGKGTTEGGDAYTYQQNVDAKWNFSKLFKEHYLPITFGEWLGTNPIEETEVKYSFSGESMTADDLFGSKVTSNYHINDIYAVIKDKKGNEVFKTATRGLRGSIFELKFSKFDTESDTWGSLEDLSSKEKYTVEIIAQLGTGERPTLYTGKFVAE